MCRCDPQEAGLQVQLLPASLRVLVREETSAGLRRDGRCVRRVWTGLHWLNRLPQVLWECILKLLCCNIDSGNLDGPTEFQLLILYGVTLYSLGYLYRLGPRRGKVIITEISNRLSDFVLGRLVFNCWGY